MATEATQAPYTYDRTDMPYTLVYNSACLSSDAVFFGALLVVVVVGDADAFGCFCFFF